MDEALQRACADALWVPIEVAYYQGGELRVSDGWRDHSYCDRALYEITPEFLESEIEQRGLRTRYVSALVAIAAPGAEQAIHDVYYVDTDAFWGLIRATPDQRARAFLIALNKEY